MKKQRIKKYVYDPFTKYVLFLLPLGMTALAFVFCIFGVRHIINNEIGEGIVILCTAILSIIGVIVTIKMAYRNCYLSSRIILDEEGVRYQSKRHTYTLMWEDIKKIEIKAPRYTYYIFFYKSDDKKENKRNKIQEISEDLIFVYMSFEIIEFIEENWNCNLNYNSEVKKGYSKYKLRKEK